MIPWDCCTAGIQSQRSTSKESPWSVCTPLLGCKIKCKVYLFFPTLIRDFALCWPHLQAFIPGALAELLESLQPHGEMLTSCPFCLVNGVLFFCFSCSFICCSCCSCSLSKCFCCRFFLKKKINISISICLCLLRRCCFSFAFGCIL